MTLSVTSSPACVPVSSLTQWRFCQCLAVMFCTAFLSSASVCSVVVFSLNAECFVASWSSESLSSGLPACRVVRCSSQRRVSLAERVVCVCV